MASKKLLRNGTVLTMDPRLGIVQGGDILIENGIIAAIGPDLPADDAEIIDVTGQIVAPGLIDTHRHAWQTNLRAICRDWTLVDYIMGIRLGLSPQYRPEDVYLGNLLGALDALNAGVTTIMDFSHCNNTPEHPDAAIAGLREAGIRAVFGYGFYESSPLASQGFPRHADRIADFKRVAGAWSAGPGDLLTLGVALTEHGLVPFEASVAEINAARECDALMVTHTGCIWSLPSGLEELEQAGLLGPDMVHAHCNTLTPAEWQIMARTGGKLSTSPETELNMGMGRLAISAAIEHGIKPTLSADITSMNSGDLFTQLRMAISFKRWADTEALNLAGKDPVAVSTSTQESLEWITVNAAEALGMADQIGSLSPGKQADIIVVGGPGISQRPQICPAATLVFQTSPQDVRHVLVAGEFVKRDGGLVGVELSRLLDAGERSGRGVIERVEASGRPVPGTPPNGFADLVPVIEALSAG